MSDFLTAQFPVAVLQVVQAALNNGTLVLPGASLGLRGTGIVSAFSTVGNPTAVPLPSGWNIGDFAMLAMLADSNVATLNPPTGWALIGGNAGNLTGANSTMNVALRVLDGSENLTSSGELSFPAPSAGNQAVWGVLVSGIDYNILVDGHQSTHGSNASNDFNPIGGITTHHNAELIIAFAANLGQNNPGGLSTPAGLSLVGGAGTALFGPTSSYVVWNATKALAGATGNFASTGGGWVFAGDKMAFVTSVAPRGAA